VDEELAEVIPELKKKETKDDEYDDSFYGNVVS